MTSLEGSGRASCSGPGQPCGFGSEPSSRLPRRGHASSRRWKSGLAPCLHVLCPSHTCPSHCEAQSSPAPSPSTGDSSMPGMATGAWASAERKSQQPCNNPDAELHRGNHRKGLASHCLSPVLKWRMPGLPWGKQKQEASGHF